MSQGRPTPEPVAAAALESDLGPAHESGLEPGAAAQPVLEVRALRVTLRANGRAVTAVRGVDFGVRRGEVLGVVGESGAGKSATALALMGLLPGGSVVSGSVRLRGRELLGLDDDAMSEVRGNALSMIFQDPLSALTPVYSVGEAIVEAIRVHRALSRRAAAARAVELLDLVGIPDPHRRARSYPHEFSGGMRQRVMIAMAIANDPDVILCDEPTTALDVTVQAQVLHVLETVRRATGAAILMITHDLGLVAGFADRVLVMYAGRVVEHGTVEDVFARSRMPYTMGLLGSVPRVDLAVPAAPLLLMAGTPSSPTNPPSGCPFAPRCPMVVDRCARVEPPLLAWDSPTHTPGHLTACHRAEVLEREGLGPAEVFPLPTGSFSTGSESVGRPERPEVLRVEGLVRHHPGRSGAPWRRRAGAVPAVDGISFDIRAGETLALVGESGAGKTTTLLEILRLDRPQAGRVILLGRDSATLSRRARRRARRDIQVVFQDPRASLDPRMPVAALLAEALRTHPAPGRNRLADARRVRDLLRLVDLDMACAGRYPQDLSGGQLQRVAIARALATQPRLVVLDEPVSSLDVSVRAGVVALLAALQARLGTAYLFVAHDLALVRHLAHRVAVMYRGRIAEIGQARRVFAVPAHPYTQALLSAVPIPDPVRERARVPILLPGETTDPVDPGAGCRFRGRCPRFAVLGPTEQARCLAVEPRMAPVSAAGPPRDQAAACHFPTTGRTDVPAPPPTPASPPT